MRRGEIRLVDFEPVRGSEADKRRPAVLVSNDRANAAAARRGNGVVSVVGRVESTSMSAIDDALRLHLAL